MCGIVWDKQRNGKAAVKRVRKLYHAQKHRGSQGFGYVEISKEGVGQLVRALHEDEIFKTLSKSEATEILFHHRFPTSTPNTRNTAHPIPVSNKSLKYDYYGVHNGVIQSPGALKAVHEKDGYEYNTKLYNGVWSDEEKIFYSDKTESTVFNDSETLMIDLARAIESGADKTLAKGSIAFMMIQYEKITRKPVKMFFGRNTSPLMMDIDNTFIKISSMGSGIEVEAHKLHCYDYQTGEIKTLKYFQIGEKIIEGTYTGWAHGRRWSKELGTYVNEVPEKKEAGFDTTQARLPAPREVAKETAKVFDMDDEEFGNNRESWTLIEDLEEKGSPLVIHTSSGAQEFWFVEELNSAYSELLEDVSFYRSSLLAAIKRGDQPRIDELRTCIDIYENDIVTFYTAIKRTFPNESIKKDDRHTVPVHNVTVG